MSQARDEALADRIGDIHKSDRYGLGFLPPRRHRPRSNNQDRVWRQAD
jgi:hypothetical protein